MLVAAFGKNAECEVPRLAATVDVKEPGNIDRTSQPLARNFSDLLLKSKKMNSKISQNLNQAIWLDRKRLNQEC